MSSLPLEGIRILDLTMWWSGPICTSYLGALGAEVIKIESVQLPDGFRYSMSTPGENWWEMGPQFNGANMNKLDLTLNLNDPEGITLFKELVAKSDVVIENFTPRVMENFGLSYDVLCEVNPQIIMMSMPAYGKTGPYRDQPGFAFTFEILSGIVQTNGYRDENPMIVAGVADVISGFHASFALLAALEYKAKTGKGQSVEVAQVEGCANLMGQPIADFSMNGRNWGRMGNRQPGMAPHGIYRSKGDDAWVAIAVTTEEEWRNFCNVIGNPAWTDDERFRTIEGRCKYQTELDQLVENWTNQFENQELASLLQKSGVIAGPVLHVDEVVEAPYLNDMFQSVNREYTDTKEFPTWPVKFSGQRLQHQSPAPTLGQHNEYVLKGILELTEEHIASLNEKDIIGVVPLSARKKIK